MAPILDVTDLRVSFRTADGVVQAVRGVDLAVDAGQVVGVVGESGSGKSVTMLATMGLLARNAVVSGSVRYRGRELLELPRRELRRICGEQLAMIFQDPMTSLNPVFTVGAQIAEAITIHHPDVGAPAARRRAVELLDLVGIPQPERRADQYPHEFSGGMRQRAMIAMAVANDPEVLIADEPTTALDVTIQAQILDVLDDVRREKGVGIVLITHDLGVVAGAADYVNVMYAGRVVERGPTEQVFYGSRMPYTRGLLRSLPRLDAEPEQLTPIDGTPPSLLSPPPGCAFHPRCPHAQEVCRVEDPALRPVEAVEAACHFAEDLDTDHEPVRSLS